MPARRCIALLFPVLLSCDFEYAPTILEELRGEPHLNLRAQERLAAAPRAGGLVRIAVLSDTHLWYDELRAAVASLNADDDLDLIVVAGDVTKYGYADEYETFSEIMSGLKAPALVAIGNHDLQADGKALYERLYGPTDFAFDWAGYRIVCFDDNSRGIPDGIPAWEWLDSTLAGAGDSLRIVTVAHAPPFSDQLDSARSERLARLYADRKVLLAIAGHTHHFEYGTPHGGDVAYLVADDIGDRNYSVVTLDGAAISVERRYF